MTRNYKVVCIEDLHVKGMLKNHCLSRAVADAGFGTLRQMIEYKASLRGVTVVAIDRWYPSSQLCSGCGERHHIPLGKDTMVCGCGNTMDRDVNAAINIERVGLDTLEPDLKRTQEREKTSSEALVLTA